MKRVFAFFTDRRVLTVLGLIALSVLIWFGGPYIRFGEENYAPLGSVVARLVAIIVLLALWGLINLWNQLKGRQRTSKLLSAVQNLQGDKAPQDGQAAEEMEVMGKRFADALSILKRTQFKGKKGNKALYDLPWYIIIGPPGSGKTTALINSGLEFPLADQMGKGAIGGIGGTRNCDWWFTNEAVLIDTAGRYTTQDSHKVVDSSAWNGFLNLLSKHRKRRPINGAIIAVSIQDILIQTADERTYHARTIRARIDELVEQLGVNFPIYFMFTKCDLIAGFSEYFEEFGLEQREQVWGMTFPISEEGNKGNAFDLQMFEQKYNELLGRLHQRVVDRSQRERDTRRRVAIFNFPHQFEAMKGNIEDFLKQTFAPNRFQEQPFLRGVYFSSGTQEGTPIDRMMNSVAGNFGMSPEVVSLSGAQGKSYFINRLFRNIVFPEAELVGSNRQYEILLKWLRRGAYASFCIVFLASVIAWTAAYSRNQTFLEQVAQHIERFKTLSSNIHKSDTDLRHIIPALEELRAASRVYDQEDMPWLVSLGMHDSRVDQTAKSAYATQLQKLMLPRLAWRLEEYLKKSTFQDPKLHETLLTYLMLGDTKRLQPDVVHTWMTTDWEEMFRGQNEVQAALTVHMDNLLALDFTPIQFNEVALNAGRAELRKVPVAKRIYNRIKSDPKFNRKVDMTEILGDGVRTAFSNDTKSDIFFMPFIFTKEGYEQVDLSEDSPVISDMFKDRWIMEDRDEKAYNDNELGKIREQVKEYYLEEYVGRWSQFVRGLKMNGFNDLDSARRMISKLADPVYSPILSVLKVTKANTQLTPDVPDIVAEKAGALTKFFGGEDGSKQQKPLIEGTKVDQYFRDINLLTKERKNSPARINSALTSLADVQGYLNDIILSPDTGEAAFNAARTRLTSRGDDVIKRLRIEASRMPEPIQGWLLMAADESWRLLLINAKSHISQQWRNDVYNRYNANLAGRFPIFKNAVDELALFDFSEFFKPGGFHDKFVQTYLSPFIDVGDTWNVKRLDDRGLYISGEAIAQVRRAIQIKGMLFKDNPSSPGFAFSMQPYRMDPSVRKFELVFGGQRLVYTHGPKIPKAVSWPGDGSTGVRMMFEDLNDSIKRVSFDGPWAFMRLLQESEVSPTRRSNVYQITFQTLGRKSTWEVTAKSANNPFRDQVIDNYRCPEAL